MAGWMPVAKLTYFAPSIFLRYSFWAICRHLMARLSCGQSSIGFSTGFSIPVQFLGCCWRRSGPVPDRRQWNGRRRPLQTIHVFYGMGVGASPCGTFCHGCAGCVLVPNLEADTDFEVADSEPSPDIQGPYRMTGHRGMMSHHGMTGHWHHKSLQTRAYCWARSETVVASVYRRMAGGHCRSQQTRAYCWPGLEAVALVE
jgi:hypothetical protein